MKARAEAVLEPTVACLGYYRERILGVRDNLPFGVEECRHVRQAIMAGVAISTEIDHRRHAVLASEIDAQPGRRYLRSGDVVYVVSEEWVISVFRIALDSIRLGYLVLRPCVAVYVQKVLGIDTARYGLGDALAARTRTMIVADLIQSERCHPCGGESVDADIGRPGPDCRRIGNRTFTLSIGPRGFTIIRAVRVGAEGPSVPIGDRRVA